MSDRDPSEFLTDEAAAIQIESGKRLVRAGDRGLSLGERLTGALYRLTWRTPLHGLRLNGRYPLKLLAVPEDPVAGNPEAGRQLVEGLMVRGRERLALADVDFTGTGASPALATHIERFAWLRDLAAGVSRTEGAEIAEALMRVWLDCHGTQVTDPAWSPDRVGWRMLFWAAHAPLILSSTDLVYRSAVLNTLARGARHLDRGADRAPAGIARIAAWSGVVAAGLLIPGGDPRRAFGETGLGKALATGISADGGIVTRAPADQVDLVELLSMLAAVYDVRRVEMPAGVQDALSRAVAALIGVQMGDSALSSWQGAGPISAARIDAVVTASRVRTRPLRQARDWGYQRMAGGQTVVVADMAPPPPSRIAKGGCASTLAFELSDGAQRLIVNCGNTGGTSVIPADLAKALRTTAAHSTLTLGDSNSTAIHADGTLGAGVGSVEVDREELEGGSRIDASHDGYARRFGLIHKRTLALSASGRELRGEDALLPAPKRRKVATSAFAIRFHLAPGVEVTPTADGQAALLRIAQGPLWQFRCRGGKLSVEDSLWVDADGRPHATQQFVIEGEAPAGGTSVAWLLKRAG
ncbi:heparinase II/III family protein [Sphingomonas sp. SUN039]|uniref:heparinase II/III family protein n=1 Tax=Sphingomonas sp. SUN039 TaxID=2937787 RepID=UPI0021649591|nr:heparinase II/III family protein [Sphingomonas sp. SUN039]UVO55047.1 heparinase II/III family protein [Sphingomonas sp. SUN039]